jgi:hypothetical protein
MLCTDLQQNWQTFEDPLEELAIDTFHSYTEQDGLEIALQAGIREVLGLNLCPVNDNVELWEKQESHLVGTGLAVYEMRLIS